MMTSVGSIHQNATDVSLRITDAGGEGIRLIRLLVVINLGLVALQALSAGFLLSGYELAARAHKIVALALELCVLVLVVTALVLWRRRRVRAGVAGTAVGLL